MRWFAIVWLAILVGCQDDESIWEPGCDICTEELRARMVSVVDSSGQFVDGLTTRTVFVPTGEVLAPPFPGLRNGEGGWYVLVDDTSHAQELTDPDGEPFRFEITSTPTPVTEVFIVRSDDCHCHIIDEPTAQITLP